MNSNIDILTVKDQHKKKSRVITVDKSNSRKSYSSFIRYTEHQPISQMYFSKLFAYEELD